MWLRCRICVMWHIMEFRLGNVVLEMQDLIAAVMSLGKWVETELAFHVKSIINKEKGNSNCKG